VSVDEREQESKREYKIFAGASRHSGLLLVGLLFVTLLLVFPLVLLQPEDSASIDPPGMIRDTQELLNERFDPAIYTVFYAFETETGQDILTANSLRRIKEAHDAVRAHPEVGAKLLERFDSGIGFADLGAGLGFTHFGFISLVDAVQFYTEKVMGISGGLAHASDGDVKIALSRIFDLDVRDVAYREVLSSQRTSRQETVDGQEITWWESPALAVAMLADSHSLGGAYSLNIVGGQEDKEQYARDVQDIFRDVLPDLNVYGLGFDLTLVQEEQAFLAAPYIVAAIFVVLVVVAFAVRSYWALALVGGALGMLIIWLQGLANLIGLEKSIIMSYIVPISMLSFGVDFAIHALYRYREETAKGHRPPAAFVTGMTGIMGALTLAMASDSVAFLSNVTSEIPSVIQFGVGAGCAAFSSYLLLGLFVPLALMRVEERLGLQERGQEGSQANGLLLLFPARGGQTEGGLAKTDRAVWRWVLYGLLIFVATLSMLLTILLGAYGVISLVVYLLLFLFLPYWRATRAVDSHAAAFVGGPDMQPFDAVLPQEVTSLLPENNSAVTDPTLRLDAVTSSSLSQASRDRAVGKNSVKIDGGGVVQNAGDRSGQGVLLWKKLGTSVVFLASYRRTLLAVVLMLTGVCVFIARNMETSFDVRDYISSDTDFVRSLDLIDEHFGDSVGEGLNVYMETDLTDIRNVRAFREFYEELEAGSVELARDRDTGELQTWRFFPDMLQQVLTTSETAERFYSDTGVLLTDEDNDGLPDTSAQLRALYEQAMTDGIAYDDEHLFYDPDTFAEVFWLSPDGKRQGVSLSLAIPDSQSSEKLRRTHDEIVPYVERLAEDIRSRDPNGFVGVAGSALTRQAGLDATGSALSRSLPVAVLGCLMLTVIFMRSIRFGLVSILPIILVSVWLYAFMVLVGFSLNFVTATIAAISIGTGADFSVHFTMRFREEFVQGVSVEKALEGTAVHTGGALLASAVSSIAGFSVLIFAPVPMVSSFGILTVVMVLLAIFISLFVLPSLLLVVVVGKDPEKFSSRFVDRSRPDRSVMRAGR